MLTTVAPLSFQIIDDVELTELRWALDARRQDVELALDMDHGKLSFEQERVLVVRRQTIKALLARLDRSR